MEMRKSVALALAPVGAAAAMAAIVLAGPMDPPAGPVASTYKTLGDIEPRTAIQSLSGNDTARYVISRPGSYYLTGDVTGLSGRAGIEIQAGNVSIDLNGFTLAGVPGSLDAIWASDGAPKPAISVSNGVVTGWGGNGVDLHLQGTARVEGVRAHNNSGSGILVGANGMVTNCQANSNGGFGVWAAHEAVISHSTASRNTGDGLHVDVESVLDHVVASDNAGDGFEILHNAVASHCTASGNQQTGFRVGNNSTISFCTATSNTVDGISGMTAIKVDDCTATHNGAHGIALMGHGNAIDDCLVRGNQRDGIRVFNTSLITGCSADGNAIVQGNNHAGIRLIGQANRVDGNYISANSIGLRMDGQGNIAVRNSFSFDPVRINAEPGNNYAQIVVIPGNDFVSTDPWTNFAH
jgi:hypothetical protein